jgi:hypothetical protein
MEKYLHGLVCKCVLLFTFALTLHFSSFSQLSGGTYWEAGITVGPMGFVGDLGGHAGKGTTFLKDYNISGGTKLTFGAFVAAYPSEWLGLRLDLNYGGLSGNDALIVNKGGDEDSRKNRNLDFRTSLAEAFFAAEIYPTVFFESEPTDVQGRLRPYALIGIGAFHFNPQGTYTDPSGVTSWVDLRPLHTEGEGFPEYPERKEYSLTQINIPMGVGVKYYLNENINISFEIIHRKTFTDYLDDVSTTFVDPNVFAAHMSPAMAQIAAYMSNKSPLQNVAGSGYQPGDKRGDPTHKDAYFTAGFKLGIRLGSGNGSEWRNSTRCPVLRF